MSLTLTLEFLVETTLNGGNLFSGVPSLKTSDSQDCPPLPRPEPRLATVGVYPSLPLVPAPTSRISVDYTLYDDEIAAYTSNTSNSNNSNNNNTATPPTNTPPAVTNQKNKFEPKNEVCLLYIV